MKKITTSDNLTVKNYLEIYKNLPSSSLDSVDNLSNSPIHQLLYSQIIKFTKEELETEPRLFSIAVNNNPLLFTALLQKKAFSKNYSKELTWIINNTKEIDRNKDLYQELHIYENSKSSKPFDKDSDFELLFSRLSYYLKDLDTPFKVELSHKFYEKYKNILKPHFLNMLANQSVSSDLTFLNTFISYFQNDGVDILNEPILNRFLPKDSDYGKRFFISSSNDKKIEQLIQLGFKFDSSSYSYNNKSLILNAVDSENVRAKTSHYILNNLKNITPKNIEQLEEQNEAVDKINNTQFLNFKTFYNYQLMQITLPDKQKTILMNQPKI